MLMRGMMNMLYYLSMLFYTKSGSPSEVWWEPPSNYCCTCFLMFVFFKSSDFSWYEPLISIPRAPWQIFKNLETFRGCIVSWQLFHKVDIFFSFLIEHILGWPNLRSQKLVVPHMFLRFFLRVRIFTMCQTTFRRRNDLSVAHTHNQCIRWGQPHFALDI